MNDILESSFEYKNFFVILNCKFLKYITICITELDKIVNISLIIKQTNIWD